MEVDHVARDHRLEPFRVLADDTGMGWYRRIEIGRFDLSLG
jgi:hypothetical protein